MENERIKLCLECDRLISFEAIRCPFCQSLQIFDDSRTCPRCSQQLHLKSVTCPKCGTLTVKTAPVPHAKTPVTAEDEISIRSYKIAGCVIASLAIILQVLLILDYLILT